MPKQLVSYPAQTTGNMWTNDNLPSKRFCLALSSDAGLSSKQHVEQIQQVTAMGFGT